MKKTILMIIASLLLTTQVWADHSDKRGKKPMMKVLAQLDLSDQQKQDIKEQLKNSRGDRAIYREDGKQLKSALRDIVDADSWDPIAATEALQASADIKQVQLNNRALTQHNVWLLLTDSQQQELNTISAERENAKEARNGRKLDRKDKWSKIEKRLALSDEQSAAIEDIRTEFEQQQATFKQVRKSHKAIEKTIIRSESFDQQAWESLYAEHEQSMLEHAVARAYMQHQVLQVLTDEQQTKLHKLQRKMKNKKHRSRNS